MKRFLAGIVLGFLLGTIAHAVAAIIAGDDGHLRGWTVVKEGEEICESPFVWNGTREIECD